MSNFRRLTRLFLDRYFDSEALASGSGLETNLYAVIGLAAALEINLYALGPLFFTAYVFGITGFATVFEWEMLFPDRRDFLVLTPFPIRVRDLFAAKLASLALFLSAIVIAVHAYIPFFFFRLASGHASIEDILRKLAGQIAATCAAAVFGFSAIAGLQGICLNLCSPHAYRRVSPWAQTFAMCLMVFAILLYPVYSLAANFLPAGHAGWVWWIPPYWLWGISALFETHPAPAIAALGIFGCKALMLAVLIFCSTWAAAYLRHYHRTLEAENVFVVRPLKRRSIADGLLRSSEARAIYYFTGQTLARSAAHRLFLATYLSTGISMGLLWTLTVTKGRIGLSEDGLRGLPPLITFFVISGFRAAFQFPAELRANWLFQLAESDWGEDSRRASRLRVLVSGLIPALAVLLPLEIAYWGFGPGLLHIAVQAVAAALLIEVLFYSFDKIPFTCSYFPGGLNLIFLSVAYLYGFTSYSFRIADLETWLETRPQATTLFFAAAATILLAIHRYRPGASGAIRFDANEPEIQTLDLT